MASHVRPQLEYMVAIRNHCLTMDPNPKPVIPIRPADDGGLGCASAEPFALMVLGESMLPEFAHGDIVVVEPGGLARDGAFVVAGSEGDWGLRQLARRGDGWLLRTLSGGEAPLEVPDLATVRGVVIQRSRPGRRRESKSYLPG